MAVEKQSSKRTKLDESIDNAFMQSAAISAIAGVRIGHGGPFGASIVRDGVIIATAHNMVLHRKDPCCHAEMNCISQACRNLGTHDLSDCDLYTSCEPCPMCWGAVQWSRLNKAFIGVDRHTAAKYGFDDKVFYDEIDSKAGTYGLKLRHGTNTLADSAEPHENMVEIFDGILHEECKELFKNPKINKTLKRRFSHPTGSIIQKVHSEIFADATKHEANIPPPAAHGTHEEFMRIVIRCVQDGVRDGINKEREPFGAVVVKDGKVISQAVSTAVTDRDATATAEVNAIRRASQRLGTHNLEGCEMYCSAYPDLMSLGAVLWSRISRVYCGLTQTEAAASGFEDGILHFRDLVESGKRVTEVVEGVAKEECENVFKEWSNLNGVLY